MRRLIGMPAIPGRMAAKLRDPVLVVTVDGHELPAGQTGLHGDIPTTTRAGHQAEPVDHPQIAGMVSGQHGAPPGTPRR